MDVTQLAFPIRDTDQVIYGLAGTCVWIRRKVWFWQRQQMERCGWYISNSESGLLRSVMIYRHDGPFFPVNLSNNRSMAPHPTDKKDEEPDYRDCPPESDKQVK